MLQILCKLVSFISYALTTSLPDLACIGLVEDEIAILGSFPGT